MKRRTITTCMLACGLMLCAMQSGLSQDRQDRKDGEVKRVVGHVLTPEKRAFDESLLKRLRLPAGFQIGVFAKDIGNPRMIAVGADGTVYVTRRQQGDVIALRDRNGDGKADDRRTIVSGIEQIHGIAIKDNRLYLSPPTKLLVADIKPDGSVSTPREIINDLPDGGQHPNRTLGFSPDGMLYINVGSSCNACRETNPEHAAMLRVRPDGTNRTIFATGLRNTLGFDWHPQTRELWGMDHGSDWRGDDIPPEELNRLTEGGDYGWPFCYGKRVVDTVQNAEPEGMTRAAYCAKTVPTVLDYTSHSAALDFIFYNATQFPADYRGDAFVAMRGSWNRNPPSGYKVVRVKFENGKPVRFEDFVTGFLLEDGREQFARPVGLAIARDGSLLLTEDDNGVIYRISYQSPQRGGARR